MRFFDDRVAVAMTMGCLCASCSPPSINRFTVAPGRVCRGGQVTASWDSSNGAAILHVTPESLPTTSSNVNGSGSLPFSIFRPTAFNLEVRPTAGTATPANQARSAEVLHALIGQNVGGSDPCPHTSPAVLRGTLVGDPPGLRVINVSVSRPMTVMHEGRTADFSSGAGISRGLLDTAFDGEYVLSVPLTPGEICQGLGTAGAMTLNVNITVTGGCPADVPGGSTVPPTADPPDGVGIPSNWSPCGLEGQRCCGSASCASGLTCPDLGGFCQRGSGGRPADPCNDPSGQVHIFGIKDQYGCAGPTVAFQTVTDQQAQQCAEAYARTHSVQVSSNFVVHHPPWHYVPRGGVCTGGVQPAVYDDSDAEGCLRHLECEAVPCDSVGAGDCP